MTVGTRDEFLRAHINLTAQVTTMAGIEATATGNTVWPHGKWPDAATSTFDNGTRLDGSAEWSIR